MQDSSEPSHNLMPVSQAKKLSPNNSPANRKPRVSPRFLPIQSIGSFQPRTGQAGQPLLNAPPVPTMQRSGLLDKVSSM